jgi:hypothetical protein
MTSLARAQLPLLAVIAGASLFACSSSQNADGGGGNTDALSTPDGGSASDTGGSMTDAGGSSDTGPNTQDGATADSGAPDTGMMMSVCDPVSETGCPANQSCFLVPVSPTAIAPECHATSAMPANDGQSCMPQMENCKAGASCIQVTGDAMPVCHRVCHMGTSADCMTAGSTVAATCVGLGGSTFGLCVPACNPVMDMCPGTEACALTGNGGTACAPGGAQPGANCGQTGTCTKGHVCVGTSAANATCAQACDATHACPAGKMCQMLPGYMFGACA